jgi:4a-hydroxytetrahydrobiopterin dehydratase
MKHFIEMNDHLKAIFTFGSFIEAIDFVNQVADLAEQAGHHPDILIHDYKKVTLTLTTHDQGSKITKKDWDLANQIEQLAN